MMRPPKTLLDRAILLTGNTILADFAKKHKVTVAELRAKRGSRDLIEVRQEAMKTLHQAGFTCEWIGGLLNRSGNTVSYQVSHSGGHGD